MNNATLHKIVDQVPIDNIDLVFRLITAVLEDEAEKKHKIEVAKATEEMMKIHRDVLRKLA